MRGRHHREHGRHHKEMYFATPEERQEHVKKRRAAQTFRRARALQFLQQLKQKEETLLKQLAAPELQTAKPVISGELKATQAIIAEYTSLFELYEIRNSAIEEAK